ncbi:hypothetical protein I4X03_014405 [Massilia sp. R798]|uniref:Uncharacterized protein n=1 Tax=Massilia soli TaxID=2792854 RepID=A0ABS7SR84_9BURK|nr:hypothetical protein [Massilia soli]
MTTVELAGFKSAILRRDMSSGGFDGNIGREVELTFSIQPCREVSVQDKVLTCADRTAAPPIYIARRIALIGGRHITVELPEGVKWTYQVLDQKSPFLLQ